MADERLLTPQYDRKGRPVWSSTMSKPDASSAVCHIEPDRVIPVIFVPGVMGSNLIGIANTPAQGVKWLLDSSSSMLPWLNRGVKERHKCLNPAYMKVYGDGKIDPAGDLPPVELRKKRGWGEVGYMSYGEYLATLHRALNDFHCGNWANSARQQLVGKALGAEKGEAALQQAEVALSYRYAFPVYACGYNWLDDNKNSAKKLQARITQALAEQKKLGHRCEKVIVVTHSMGGLVARYCSQVDGMADKILGVVHGVMPAIGAAAVYRRMKAGTEYQGPVGKLTSEILGGNGAEMTTVLAQSPGPLQLLPTPEYGNGWLRIEAEGEPFALPQAGDPYSEIYTVRGKWWSLCEEQWIDADVNVSDTALMNANWKNFENLIKNAVQPFHQKITRQYHPVTHAFFGSSTDHLSFGLVRWKGGSSTGERWLAGGRRADIRNARALDTTETGDTRTVSAPLSGAGWKTGIHQSYQIAQQDEPGDGTVPHRSGRAPLTYVKALLQVNTEHEPAYRDCVAGQHFTLRAIVQIAQLVKQTSLAYPD